MKQRPHTLLTCTRQTTADLSTTHTTLATTVTEGALQPVNKLYPGIPTKLDRTLNSSTLSHNPADIAQQLTPCGGNQQQSDNNSRLIMTMCTKWKPQAELRNCWQRHSLLLPGHPQACRQSQTATLAQSILNISNLLSSAVGSICLLAAPHISSQKHTAKMGSPPYTMLHSPTTSRCPHLITKKVPSTLHRNIKCQHQRRPLHCLPTS